MIILNKEIQRRNIMEKIKGKLGFGCMRLPYINNEIDLEQTKEMVDLFLENGFNYFDTAHGYLNEQSEYIVKECLTKRHSRDKYLIATKLSPNYFNKNEDISVARAIIKDNIEKIKEIAKSEVIANGYNYDVNVSLEKDNFPTKDYGDIVLPAGEYEALKIEIGSACGQNWWCVLFPPLCFVDESCVSYSSAGAQKVISNVGQKNAPLIKKDKSTGYKIKFKSYEIWQTGKQTLAYLFGIR
jgi:stage II sporulation protein R